MACVRRGGYYPPELKCVRRAADSRPYGSNVRCFHGCCSKPIAYILFCAYRLNSANRQIGVCRFPSTLRFYCRGGIHASRAHGTFSPKRRENRNVSPPGGMNASPTVFFQRFLNGPTNTNLSSCCDFPGRRNANNLKIY